MRNTITNVVSEHAKTRTENESEDHAETQLDPLSQTSAGRSIKGFFKRLPVSIPGNPRHHFLECPEPLGEVPGTKPAMFRMDSGLRAMAILQQPLELQLPVDLYLALSSGGSGGSGGGGWLLLLVVLRGPSIFFLLKLPGQLEVTDVLRELLPTEVLASLLFLQR